jgi:phosphatidylserine/phosphatidylglycerophosphate/cardiolipin synthase-like enzyme
MKRFLPSVALIVGLPVSAIAADSGIRVCYSPKGGCTDVVVKQLNNAQQSIRIQACSFKSKPIADALLNAKQRGVKIEAILDKSQRIDRRGHGNILAPASIRVLAEAYPAAPLEKVIVIDNKTALTGSFQFARADAQLNRDVLLVVHDQALVDKHARDWQEHEGHSEPYGGR